MRMKLDSPGSCTGNVFWWGTVVANPEDEREIELQKLVGQLREALDVYNNDKEFLEILKGEDQDGFDSGMVNLLGGMISLESEKPEIFGFTRWSGSFFNELEFGWGKPFWVGVMGKAGPAYRNAVVLVDSTQWVMGLKLG